MLDRQINKKNCYTLHFWRNNLFEGILDKNLLACLYISVTHGVFFTSFQSGMSLTSCFFLYTQSLKR